MCDWIRKIKNTVTKSDAIQLYFILNPRKKDGQ